MQSLLWHALMAGWFIAADQPKCFELTVHILAKWTACLGNDMQDAGSAMLAIWFVCSAATDERLIIQWEVVSDIFATAHHTHLTTGSTEKHSKTHFFAKACALHRPLNCTAGDQLHQYADPTPPTICRTVPYSTHCWPLLRECNSSTDELIGHHQKAAVHLQPLRECQVVIHSCEAPVGRGPTLLCQSTNWFKDGPTNE